MAQNCQVFSTSIISTHLPCFYINTGKNGTDSLFSLSLNQLNLHQDVNSKFLESSICKRKGRESTYLIDKAFFIKY